MLGNRVKVQIHHIKMEVHLIRIQIHHGRVHILHVQIQVSPQCYDTNLAFTGCEWLLKKKG